ncbi:MAG TPA: OmpA family protein [Acetobacteraceae bacterium]|nr:OmpA family protein [Acetobacteraceae bacterium]
MQLRGALLAASLLALPIVASAQPVTGLYVSGGAGVNLMQNENIQSFNVRGATFFPSGSLGSRVGPAFVGAVGWGFGNGLRVELEMDYRANQFDSVNNGAAAHVGGWEQKYGPMVNVAYDFNGLGPIVPYIGVGVGYQVALEQNVHAYNAAGSTSLYSRSDGSFAYQAIVGVAYPIVAAPGLALTAEYRFMGLAGNRSYGAYATNPAGGVVATGSVKLNDDYNHAFLVGFRYNFGQAPPPAPAPVAAPAPAVMPARSYLVFFDWDKATLTDRARQIIREAADNSTHVKVTQIQVNGYTDTSGTPQYNMGLSIRRAGAVKAELIRDGVPAGEIFTRGFGETHLLVPTGPGVREPQNRRVEIILH